MSREFEKWEKIKSEVMEAIRWNELPEGPKYDSKDFSISYPHCSKPVLVRSGQKEHNGSNYWNSPDIVNATLLEYIIENWEEIWPVILKRINEKESKALSECQDFVSKMQDLIDQNKNGGAE